MSQTFLNRLGQLLLGKLPDLSDPGVFGTPISPDAPEGEVRMILTGKLQEVFNERRSAIHACEIHTKEDETKTIAEALVLSVLTTLLTLSALGATVRVAALVVGTAARSALRNALGVAVGNVASQIVDVAAEAANASDRTAVYRLFRAEEKALNFMQSEAITALASQITAVRAGAASAAEANAICEEMRIGLARLALKAYDDQYLMSAGMYAASLAQPILGRYDPAYWDNYSSTEERGTDIFTKENAHLKPGVLSWQLYTYGGRTDPLIKDETGEWIVNPDFEPHYRRGILAPTTGGQWNGKLPEPMLRVLHRFPLAEWRVPKIIQDIGPWEIRVNEREEVVVFPAIPRPHLHPPPWVPLDEGESRRIYETWGKPVMMKM